MTTDKRNTALDPVEQDNQRARIASKSSPCSKEDSAAAVRLSDKIAGAALARMLYQGSATFLAIYITGSAISFGIHLLIARMLGAASYGHFAYAASWMAILILGCNIGLKPTAVRYASHYLACREWGLLRGFLRTSTKWTIVASTIVVSLALAALFVTRPRLDELGATLVLICLAMPLMALGEVWSSAARGLGAVTRSQVPASIAQHTLFGILLAASIGLRGSQADAATAAGAFLVATLGTLLLSHWILAVELHRRAGVAGPLYARSEWRDTACGNVLIALFQAARVPAVVLIAAVHVDAEQIAFYVAAHRLANTMSLGLLGVSGFVSPLISEHYTLKDIPNLSRLAGLAAAASALMAITAALSLFAFGGPLLRLFGDGFESAYPALMMLVCGELAAAAVGPVGQILTMTGGQRIAASIEGMASALTVVLAFILIPEQGIFGAAIAVAMGSVLRNGWMLVDIWRRLGVRSLPL